MMRSSKSAWWRCDSMLKQATIVPHVDRSDVYVLCFFFFQAEDGIRDYKVTGVQTCALPICPRVPGIFHPHLVAGIEKHSRQEVQRLLGARCHDDLFSRTTYSAGVAHIFRDGSSQRWITTCITLPIQRTRCFAINARRNPRPQFDWKQVDSRLVAPKRLTDGMRSWQ